MSSSHTGQNAGTPGTNKVFLTLDLIEAGMSRNGAWSRAQTECLGVPWPLVSGWKVNLIGTFVTEAQYLRFLALKNVHLRKN